MIKKNNFLTRLLKELIKIMRNNQLEIINEIRYIIVDKRSAK